MSRTTVVLALLGAAAVAVMFLSTSGVSADDIGDLSAYPSVAQVKDLREEISLLNLLNGLYLTRDQVDKLIPLAEQSVAIKQKALGEMNAAAADYVYELGELREALYTTTGPTPALRDRAGQDHQKLEIEPRDIASEEIGRLEDQARAIFTEAQICIIEDFKPCLNPPKTLSDPVAVGQASTTEKEELLLDLVRRMPDDLYRLQRDRLAELIVARGEKEKGKTPEDVHKRLVATYCDKMDKLRTLEEADFEMGKSELAESFRLFDDEVTYHKGHTRELGKIMRLFLNENGVRVMKRWRDARVQDNPETVLEQPAVESEGPKDAKFVREGIMRYGKLTYRLLNERRKSGEIDPAKAEQLQQRLLSARDLDSPPEQFKIVSEICDELNTACVTPLSVEAELAQVTGWAYLKRVPGIRPGGARDIPDVTGLGARVTNARALADAGKPDEAYAALRAVADTLKQFRG